jgi:hypothetical protein
MGQHLLAVLFLSWVYFICHLQLATDPFNILGDENIISFSVETCVFSFIILLLSTLNLLVSFPAQAADYAGWFQLLIHKILRL